MNELGFLCTTLVIFVLAVTFGKCDTYFWGILHFLGNGSALYGEQLLDIDNFSRG
jgi:uncharacterized membrane protein